MKIQTSIRDLYGPQSELCKLLQEKVDSIIKGLIPTFWHYESRIKSEESFALKIESGRYKRPQKLEDFFGCLIVVRSAAELPDAERLVKKNFKMVNRKPPDRRIHKKNPEDFSYDGLRIYIRLKKDQAIKPNPLEQITFELQIKTYLMHAWDISSHDLIYKTSAPNWGTSRVAFQIRAMLEHADLSIMEAQKLSQNPAMDITTEDFESLEKIIKFLTAHWKKVDLPVDLRRLSMNVSALLNLFRINLNQLEEIIKNETMKNRGTKIKNLSPYSIILKSILNQNPKLFKMVLSEPGNTKLLITPELEYVGKKSSNAIFVENLK
jgi:ppGpp synthetase/RelA/SpoT-type nucleotidyltranferase